MMARFMGYCFAVLVSVLMLFPAQAVSGSAGTEFIFAFQPNHPGTPELELFITGEQDTQGTVEIPGLAFGEDFTVSANEVTTVLLPSEVREVPDNGSAFLGIHVTAQDDVTVYGLHRQQYTTDAFLVLPVVELGNEYFAMSYDGLAQFSSLNLSSQIAIVATVDDTVVEITPTVDAGDNTAGQPFTVTLDRLEVYQLNNDTEDLTGTYIRSDEPVTVMSGQKCADVPSLSRSPTGGRIGWCDHLAEMMTPLDTWGQDFLTVPLATRLNGDIIRILAAENGTRILINNEGVATLNRGELYETVLTEYSEINASGPVLVAQYSPGQAFDDVVSDPFMMLIPPNEQFLYNYTFATPEDGFSRNFVNVAIPTTSVDHVLLDGSPVDPALFSVIGSSGFSGAQLPLEPGSHTMAAEQPFGIYVYGFDDYDSYGYPGGLALADLNPLSDSFAPNIGSFRHIGRTFLGTASDNEDINVNDILDTDEDLNGNGVLDRRTEDVNGNGELDAGEDIDGDGVLDRDRGIFSIELLSDAENLKLEIIEFVSGQAPIINFRLDLIDPDLPGTGTLRVEDLNGNAAETSVSLPATPALADVQLLMTVSGDRILVDETSFTHQPVNIDNQSDQIVIEWQFETLSADQIEDIGFDVTLQDPQPGEQRVVTQGLQLSYINAPDGERIVTELGAQSVVVTATAFALAAGTDQANYGPNADVQLQATVSNVGTAQNSGSVAFIVEDENGAVVEDFSPVDFAALAAGASISVDQSWNTALYIAGGYRLHTVLRDNNELTVNEAFSAFSIVNSTDGLPVADLNIIIGEDIGGGTFIEKLTYHSTDTVQVQTRITNQTENTLINGARLSIVVLDPLGATLFSQAYDLDSGLVPGAIEDRLTYISLNDADQGTYQLQATLIDTGTMTTVAQRSAQFTVVQDIALSVSGDVSAQYDEILLGDTQVCTDTVTSLVAEPLIDLPVQKTLVIIDTQEQVNAQEVQIDLAQNETITETRNEDTAGFTAGDYACVLRVDTGAELQTLGYAVFHVYNLIADPGQDQTALVGQQVVLDGSGSREAAGQPLTYQWRFVGMPSASNTTLSNADEAQAEFFVDEQGTYVVELIINNGTEDSQPKYVTITVPNRLPVADAGPDQSVTVGQTAILDGTASFDLDGDALSFTWTIQQQPAGSQSTLSDAHVANPTLNIDVEGVYLVDLVVNDGIEDSAVDTVLLNVGNVPPVADAGDAIAALLDDIVTLDGSGSSDANGDQISYRWFFVSIPQESNAFLVNNGSVAPTFQVDRAGDYVVRLTVNDGLEDSDPDFVTVSVGNSAPVAQAGPDQSGVAGTYIYLNGENSTDPDNDSLSYRWNMLSRPADSEAQLINPYTVNPEFFLDVQGDYIIQLIVNDGTVDSAPDTVIVTAGNLRPVADAQFNQTGQLFTGDTITLDGSESYDPEGGSLTYQWTLIDRPEGSNALLEDADTSAPSFTIDKQGDYIAQLIVNDGQIDSEPATVLVEGIETCIADLAIRPKNNKIQLTWTYNPETEIVEIERSLSLNGPYELIAETDSTYATYLDLELENGTTYYYRLRGRFAVENVVECYYLSESGGYGGESGYGDGYFICGSQTCYLVDNGVIDCGEQLCEIVSYDGSNITAQCDGEVSDQYSSCSPEDDYCQYICEMYEIYGECAPSCPEVYSEEDTEYVCGPCLAELYPEFDFSLCEPPVNERSECATQVIASQPVGRARIAWVPDLSGMSIDQAQTALTDVRLALGAVSFERTTAVPAGQVIRQDVPRDSALMVGSTVDIVISTRGVTE